MHLLETSLCQALRGRAHPCPSESHGTEAELPPRVFSSLFRPIFVFSKQDLFLFFLMIFVVDLSELWLLCIF